LLGPPRPRLTITILELEAVATRSSRTPAGRARFALVAGADSSTDSTPERPNRRAHHRVLMTPRTLRRLRRNSRNSNASSATANPDQRIHRQVVRTASRRDTRSRRVGSPPLPSPGLTSVIRTHVKVLRELGPLRRRAASFPPFTSCFPVSLGLESRLLADACGKSGVPSAGLPRPRPGLTVRTAVSTPLDARGAVGHAIVPCPSWLLTRIHSASDLVDHGDRLLRSGDETQKASGGSAQATRGTHQPPSRWPTARRKTRRSAKSPEDPPHVNAATSKFRPRS